MNSKYCLSFVLLVMVFCCIVACARKSDLQRGKDAFSNGAYDTALKSLREALKKEGQNPDIHYYLCLTYTALDSVEPALGHFVKLGELGSDTKDDRELRVLMATLLGIEPYPSSIVEMKGMNQFKGAFSPSGDRLAVAASRRDRADIYLIDLDGSNLRRLVTGGMNTDPVFAPDGKSIAFVSDRDGDEDLYLYDIATDELRKLTDNLAQDFAPDFAPDGKELVFVSNMDDPYKWEIYVVNVMSGRIGRLTDNKYWDGFPKYTANGQSIVFSSKRNESEDIYVMRRDGGGVELLFSSAADDNDPTIVRENLFFKSERDGEWEIYCYNIRNRQLARLTSNEWADWNPRISDDGSKLVVARRIKQRWVLYLINIAEPISSDYILSVIAARQSG
ncbi:MAG: DPP IV N-terminal domain-containing protein [candidate division WOR-3 bacterium]|nr:DPP IV N-terminal domain-containing protein [candidate division WOR-3 bacterium]